MEKKNGIVFFGTPEFAVPSLEILHQQNFPILAVVTVPDKPAGRGLKLNVSAVKEFATQHQLPVLQPESLKSPEFLDQLKSLNAHIFVVVAFRKLPEAVWKMPSGGTFNLHASLLPDYRGAAPINWAIINGEKFSGLTTFFLQEEIDAGDIIYQQKVEIGPEETAGELHDRMMIKGADLVLETVKSIVAGTVKSIPQNVGSGDAAPKPAPKLNKENSRIDIHKQCVEVANQIRGLSPYPAAHSEIFHPDSGVSFTVKIYKAKVTQASHPHPVGTMETDNKSYLRVYLLKGYIDIEKIQLAGRNAVPIRDFLNGFRLKGNWMLK